MKYVLASFLILVIGFLGIFNPFRDVIVSIVSPVQFGLTKIAFSLKDSAAFFSDSNKVRKENIALLQEVLSLKEELVGLKSVQDENSLLKQQLGVQNKFGDNFNYITAQIMGNPNDLTQSTVLIDRGTRDGVRVNDIAAYGDYLVGIVRNVEYSRSTVEMITSSNMSFTVYDIDSPDKTEGLAEGRHGSGLSLERVLSNEKVSVGDTIVTSGKDGIFAPNFIVGKITDVQNDPSQPLKNATLQTIIDISKLNNISIVQLKSQI